MRLICPREVSASRARSLLLVGLLASCRQLLGVDEHQPWPLEVGGQAGASGASPASSQAGFCGEIEAGASGAASATRPDASGGESTTGGEGTPCAASSASWECAGAGGVGSGGTAGAPRSVEPCAPEALTTCRVSEGLARDTVIVASGLQRPGCVRVDANYVYWVSEATESQTGGIGRAELSTGKVTTLASSLSQPSALQLVPALDKKNWVYFSNDDDTGPTTGGLFRVEVRDGAPVEAVDVGKVRAGALTYRFPVVYSAQWSSALGAQVRTYDVKGDSLSTLVSLPAVSGPVEAISVDDTNLYFSQSGTIYRVALSGGGVVPVLSDIAARSLKVSNKPTMDHMTWLTPTALVRVVKTDPFAKRPVCAPANQPLAFAIADAAVVYANQGDSSVRATKLGDSSVVHTVACDQLEPFSLAVYEGNETLVWSDRRKGQIMMIPGTSNWWSY